MYISNETLKEIDEDLLRNITRSDLIEVSLLLLDDLKETREQLNQNSRNSSKPPSSNAPWFKSTPVDHDDENEQDPLESNFSSDDDTPDSSEKPSDPQKPPQKPPGKQLANPKITDLK